jgi:hypothetical protein
MDRLPFASEVVVSELADMYPASHEGVLYKLIFHRGFSSCISGSSSAVQGEALVMGRVLPANLTSGGKIFPTTIPHSGWESSRRAAPLCETALFAPGRTTATPPWTQMPMLRRSLGETSEAAQHAWFTTAPSGTTPWVAYRHKAIRSRRAIATTITLRMRRPVPLTRSRNQLT